MEENEGNGSCSNGKQCKNFRFRRLAGDAWMVHQQSYLQYSQALPRLPIPHSDLPSPPFVPFPCPQFSPGPVQATGWWDPQLPLPAALKPLVACECCTLLALPKLNRRPLCMSQHQQEIGNHAIVLEPTILEATLDVLTLEAHQK